jgi:3-hydroxyacyl-[acyl-carrier-protein] dehydratase
VKLESLYTISRLSSAGDKFHASVQIDPNHPLFKGHFPGQPVVPGVVLIKIIRDITKALTQKELLLEQGTNLKFLNLVDPVKDPEFTVSGSVDFRDEARIAVNAAVSSGEMVFFKFKGVFIIFVTQEK